MSEVKFKVGDVVVLNKNGKKIVRNVPPDTVFVIGSLSQDGLNCRCYFDGGRKTIYLYCNNMELYKKHKSNEITKDKMFEQLTNQMLETFKKKNADYGNSTTETFKEFGLTSYAIRLNDKLNRIKSFCKKGELEVKDESCVDSLLDMANYCLLAIIDIKNKEAK